MASIDYRDTELWLQAKNLLIETYRLTRGWPEDGKDLAADIRSTVRQVVRAVPNAFKKGGIGGNYSLIYSSGTFAEIQALCEAAEALGYVQPNYLKPLDELTTPIRAKFGELSAASQAHAREKRKKQTRLFGAGFDDDDDDDF